MEWPNILWFINMLKSSWIVIFISGKRKRIRLEKWNLTKFLEYRYISYITSLYHALKISRSFSIFVTRIYRISNRFNPFNYVTVLKSRREKDEISGKFEVNWNESQQGRRSTQEHQWKLQFSQVFAAETVKTMRIHLPVINERKYNRECFYCQ